MKSFVLTFLNLIIVCIAMAQITKGTKLTGGSFGFGHQKQELNANSNKSTSININPVISKAVKDNVVKGISFLYSFNQNKSSNNSFTSQVAGLSLLSQKYLPLGNDFVAFGQGNIGGAYGWRGKNYNSYTLLAGLGAGLAYNANNKLLLSVGFPNAINAFAGYSREKLSNSSSKLTSFTTGLSSTVSLQSLQFGVLLMCK